MNLDFGILWIEDSFSQEEEQSLKRCVQDAGFVARIEVIENGNRIDDLARQHSLYHRYDIILLDYRLKDEKGDDLAPRIRTLFPSTTILFYSGSAQEDQLRQMIAAKQVEGVYCCRRDHLRFIHRTEELINQTARALNRLSGMRGLAMRVVAECDDLMRQAMFSMCGRDSKCSAKVVELDEDVLKFLAERQSLYEASTIDEDLGKRLDTLAVDSAKLFKHFRRLTQVVTQNPKDFGLSDAQVERLRELRKNSAQYDTHVLKKRNILGHVIEVPGDNGWVLQGTNEIGIGDFPEIRKTFAKYIDTIREIGSLVVLVEKN